MTGDSATRVLLAVVAGLQTMGDIAAEVGISRSTAYEHLTALRADGLVAWEPGLAGTIRPCVEVVAHHG